MRHTTSETCGGSKGTSCLDSVHVLVTDACHPLYFTLTLSNMGTRASRLKSTFPEATDTHKHLHRTQKRLDPALVEEQNSHPNTTYLTISVLCQEDTDTLYFSHSTVRSERSAIWGEMTDLELEV